MLTLRHCYRTESDVGTVYHGGLSIKCSLPARIERIRHDEESSARRHSHGNVERERTFVEDSGGGTQIDLTPCPPLPKYRRGGTGRQILFDSLFPRTRGRKGWG